MCGLAGFLRPAGFGTPDSEQILNRMSEALRHRGPDDAGTWLDGDAGVALGHRRLSILDLSPSGRQPMTSPSGRYVIAFNGEIYNHLELRETMESATGAVVWRGRSDTETLLAGFDRWGIEPTLKRTTGMFAIAVWDHEARKLTLARDRIGEKPLYYGWQGDVFLFGSELKALRVHPEFGHEIDRDVVAAYLRSGYIVAPRSIYRGIFKLVPGALLQISATDVAGASAPPPQRYWSLREVAESGLAQPFLGSDAEAIEELETRLQRAVSLQSVADVPLGAFLSGGVDSTTVVALMQVHASRPVKTFTVGFHEAEYQEAGYAKSVAQILGTEHTELYVTPREAMQVIPNLPLLYDEPFGDSSAIPTFLVSQFARQHVTVCLSGDGGDELFGGYTRYQRTADLWRAMARIPLPLRERLSGICTTVSRIGGMRQIGWQANRAALYLSAKTPEECYEAQLLLRHDSHEFVLRLGRGGTESSAADVVGSALPNASMLSSMMYADGVTYLPDDILTKVDRAAMGVSLETRVPMLDHNVVEFAWRLPQHMKVRGGEAKWLLKQVLRKYIPAALIDRPKMGFAVPVNQWILGPLRDWAEDLLSEDRLRRDGVLNARLARELWLRHVKHPSIEGDSVWGLLMLQSWLSARGAPS
jgi:asparagine synthase (glutamine-hydrolysing)